MAAKVLICDDDMLLRKLLIEHVSSLGYKVLEASNGHECIEIVKRSAPDVLLLDLVMPEMSGLEVIKQLKALGINDLPIFVISGYGHTMSPDEAAELGVKGFVPKPYRLNEIDMILENTLN
jgi:CheY-like chemotaxis protein